VGAVQWESVPSLNHLSDETNRDLHHVITHDGLPGIQSVRGINRCTLSFPLGY
jgi:hypothetical protein